MAKKQTGTKTDFMLRVRCRKIDMEVFRAAAEAEGFGGNVSAWVLWHLRRIAAQTLKGKK
jgi:hypothetical protein